MLSETVTKKQAVAIADTLATESTPITVYRLWQPQAQREQVALVFPLVNGGG